MPRVVDVAARRRELSEALWRIVRRDGMGAVTVRSVAAEAGVSAGMVQHYFRTQDDLVEFAMNQTLEQMMHRLAQIDLSDPDVATAMLAMEQVVPLDEQRLAEARVWLAMLSRRHARPSLSAQGSATDSALEAGIRDVMRRMMRSGAVSADRDLDVETTRLHALIDGLSLHALGDPPTIGADDIRAALRAHLDDLAR